MQIEILGAVTRNPYFFVILAPLKIVEIDARKTLIIVRKRQHSLIWSRKRRKQADLDEMPPY